MPAPPAMDIFRKKLTVSGSYAILPARYAIMPARAVTDTASIGKPIAMSIGAPARSAIPQVQGPCTSSMIPATELVIFAVLNDK